MHTALIRNLIKHWQRKCCSPIESFALDVIAIYSHVILKQVSNEIHGNAIEAEKKDD